MQREMYKKIWVFQGIFLSTAIVISEGESKDEPWGGTRALDVHSARTDLTSVNPHLQNSSKTDVYLVVMRMRREDSGKANARPQFNNAGLFSERKNQEESVPHIRHSSRPRQYTLSLGQSHW